MQRLEVSGAVRPVYESLAFKGLMELEHSLEILEKYVNIKFHENLSSVSRIVQCGQTDGRTDRQP
jgi:hypothetical protein